MAALTAGIAYVAHNFRLPSKIIVTNPAKEDIQAVKEGTGQVGIFKADNPQTNTDIYQYQFQRLIMKE